MSSWIKIGSKSNEWCPYKEKREQKNPVIKTLWRWHDSATRQGLPRLSLTARS